VHAPFDDHERRARLPVDVHESFEHVTLRRKERSLISMPPFAAPEIFDRRCRGYRLLVSIDGPAATDLC
jgi:hypothetical protein